MATRKEYIDKLENQLREWNTQINEYQKKAEGRSNELKAKFDLKIKEIKEKRAKLRLKLDKIKDSGEDTFDRLKKDADHLWDNIKFGFSEVRSILKK